MSILTFSVKGENQNATRLNVTARSFSIIVDEPSQLGGNDEGPNPVEYLLAAYAGCLNVVAHIVAKELGITINKLNLELTGEIDPARFLGLSFNERAGFKSIKVQLVVETDSDEETLKKWLQIIENRCPVNDNLANSTPLKLSLTQLASSN